MSLESYLAASILLVGQATASGGAYIHWHGANSWSNRQFSSGGFRLKATAPAGTTSIGVTLENGGTISQVSLRDVTLTVGRNAGPDECDVYNGDSGSPSLTFGRTGALDESVPCPPSNPDLDSWGLILVGTHRSPDEDNGVIGSDAAAELTTLVKDMQTGADNLKEVPIFWSGVFGDFDGDENLTVNDINILVRKVAQRSSDGYSWYLDWDKNGYHEYDDVVAYIEDDRTFHTRVGDLDVDGNVDADDANAIFNNQGIANAGWETGDLTGDGVIDNADLVKLINSQNYGWVRPSCP